MRSADVINASVRQTAPQATNHHVDWGHVLLRSILFMNRPHRNATLGRSFHQRQSHIPPTTPVSHWHASPWKIIKGRNYHGRPINVWIRNYDGRKLVLTNRGQLTKTKYHRFLCGPIPSIGNSIINRHRIRNSAHIGLHVSCSKTDRRAMLVKTAYAQNLLCAL